MQIKSVDKPAPSPFESRESAALQTREIIESKPGTDDAKSRASQFLVTGKRPQPLRAPGSVFESILGDVDRRKQILETDLTPWRMICSLDIVSQNGLQYVGTGWFVGPKTVITAGHCVFDPVELGGWAKESTVMPGGNGNDMLSKSRATRFSTTDRWINDQDRDFDYAAIHLNEDLATATGTFGLGVLPDAELIERLVNVSGYPVKPGDGQLQYFHANRVKAVTGRRLFYDIDTMGGQSGSPSRLDVTFLTAAETTLYLRARAAAYGYICSPAGH